MSDDTPTPDLAQALETLEAQVQAAIREIRDLRKRNGKLEQRVEELEQSLAAAEEQAGDEEAAAWAEERQEIQGRVERLVEGLEELLASTEED